MFFSYVVHEEFWGDLSLSIVLSRAFRTPDEAYRFVDARRDLLTAAGIAQDYQHNVIVNRHYSEAEVFTTIEAMNMRPLAQIA